MTKEEKDLLLKDLCARLPYSVKMSNINAIHNGLDLPPIIMDVNDDNPLILINSGFIPYLRPMSSMTEDEKKELHSILDKEIDRTLEKLKSGDCGIDEGKYYFNFDYELDFCLSHHFDYLGLIPMGLALEAPKDMYKF